MIVPDFRARLIVLCSFILNAFLIFEPDGVSFYWHYGRESRKKFGLLEKKKDYVKRAQAYHKKEETLRVS